MGASESTANSTPSNNNKEEENQSQQQNNNSSGSFIRAATTLATAVAGVAVVAYGVSKALSDINDNQQSSTMVPAIRSRYKMNTDGGCHPVDSDDRGQSRGPSGYGGILRDPHGNWVQGFIGFIGESDCLTSEFVGILKGLEVLDKLNLKGAILETDCQPAYDWVTRQDDHLGKSEVIRACWSIIMKCRQLVEKNEIVMSLVTRNDANHLCADKLANMAIKRKEAYVEIKDVPYELRFLV